MIQKKKQTMINNYNVHNKNISLKYLIIDNKPNNKIYKFINNKKNRKYLCKNNDNFRINFKPPNNNTQNSNDSNFLLV